MFYYWSVLVFKIGVGHAFLCFLWIWFSIIYDFFVSVWFGLWFPFLFFLCWFGLLGAEKEGSPLVCAAYNSQLTFRKGCIRHDFPWFYRYNEISRTAGCLPSKDFFALRIFMSSRWFELAIFSLGPRRKGRCVQKREVMTMGYCFDVSQVSIT